MIKIITIRRDQHGKWMDKARKEFSEWQKEHSKVNVSDILVNVTNQHYIITIFYGPPR